MTKTVKRCGLVILVLIVLAAGASVAAGCSDGEEQASGTGAGATDSTAVAGGETTVSTGSSSFERVVVGGSSAEEYEAALPDLEKAVEAAPEDLTALQELAVAQYNTGRYEEAAATYQKMLQIKDDAFTHNNYANVLRDWNKLDEAKAEYEKAISVDPLHTNAYVNLAKVLAAEGSVAEAIDVLDRGLAVITGDDKTRLETYKETLSTSTSTS